MNKGELKELLDQYLKRVDLRPLYNSWIDFSQLRIDHLLRLQEQEYRAVTTPKNQFIALPPDYIEMRHLQTSGNHGTPLQYMTPDQLDRSAHRYASGEALFYTIVNNQIEIRPAPSEDSEAEFEMFYFAKLPKLAADSQTNKVLTSFPNLYVYGCMIEASAYRLSAGDNAAYQQLWDDYSSALQTRQEVGRYGGIVQMRAS